ncbi:hypothetical protein B0H19DRAFT_1250704 [Mycena capillaripes]|nr:hypothetical protein B0H19DRAFT_1250704 [Mycena capillaripes]
MDRLAVGVGPTLGQHAGKMMKKIGRARVEELQRHREARRREFECSYAFSRTLTSSSAPILALELEPVSSSPGERSQDMDYETFHGIQTSLSRDRFRFPLPKLKPRPAKARGKKAQSADDDEETVALAQEMVESFKAGLGDPFDLWQSPPAHDGESSEDKWDPASGLPYFPRRRIDSCVSDALTMIATTLGQLEADQKAQERRFKIERYLPWPHIRLAMQEVAAQIIAVGAEKRSLE